MKRKYLITGALSLAVLAATAFGGTALAAGKGRMAEGRNKTAPTQLTATQKAEIQTKMAAVKSALEAGDYDAWVKAETAVNANSPQLKRITATNFATYAAQYKEREARQADREARVTAVNNALAAGDYDAWVKAETALNANSPALSRITASNFSQYAQAYSLRTQADTIMKNLGFETGTGMGFGLGLGHGQR